MVPKTDDEIYVSISIGKYKIFLYCVKEGRVVGNIEKGVATQKIVATMQRW